MTLPPDPRHSPNHPPRRSRRLPYTHVGTAIGITLVVGLAGGTWWAWNWIRVSLAPLVEQNLEQTLERPVDLGEVEQVGLTSIQFGTSSIPATPTDADRLTAESVVVQFSPLQLLFNRTLQLNVVLRQPDVYLEQAEDGRWVSTQLKAGEGGGFLRTDLQSIRLQNADLVLQPQPRPNLPDGAVQLSSINGVVRFLDNNQLIRFDARGEAASGDIRVAGQVRPDDEQAELTIRADDLPAIAISRVIELPIALQSGRVDGTINLQYQSFNETPEVTGTAAFENVTAQIAQIPQQFTNTNGRLQFQGETIAFDNLRTRYGEIPAQIEGTINLETGYDLTAASQPVAIETVLDTFDIDSPVPLDGQLQANLQVQGELEAPVLTGIANTVGTAEVDRVDFRSIRSRFRLTTAGEAPRLAFTDLQAVPQAGGQIVGNGQLRLGDVPNVAFTFRAADVPGDAIARLYNFPSAITVGDVSAIASITGTTRNLRTEVQFQLPEAAYPGRGELVITDGSTVFLRDAVFNVADGTVEVTGRLADGQLQATIDAAQVRLNPFSQDLRGRLSGAVQVSGSTENFQPENLRAEGQLRFSEGLAVVQEPLTAQVRFNGDQLIVQRATAPGLTASGTIDVQIEGTAAPQINQFNLAVQTEDYDLQDLGINLPQDIALLGQADFNGRVTGTPTAPSASGTVQVENLQVDGLAFEPVLTGSVNYQAGQRTRLQLAGQQDQIALVLGPNNRPRSFFVRQDQAIASGNTEGDILQVDLQNVPLALVEGLLPENALAAGPIAGNLSGDLAVNLDTYNVQGNFAVADARLGRISADLFQGQLSFVDGVATLTDGIVQQGESRIALGGTIPIGQAQPVQFQITLDQARIQNILQTLSLFEVADFASGLQPPAFGTAADIQPVPIDVANQPVLRQLRRFSEIESLLAQQTTEQETESFPTLAELQGTVSGTITFDGLLEEGLEIGFDLQGQDWLWGDYQIDRVVAEGSFRDGVLTALPVFAEIDDGFAAFSGTVGAEQLSGQLRVSDLPAELLQPFLDRSPLEVEGQLDAIATFTGSLARPNVLGELVLEAGRLNDQPVQQAQAIFGYENARLNFNSDILLSGTEPIDIVGSIPIALPFAEVQPASDQISIQANVQDEGLALVNLFTDQITWIEGAGLLNVAVGGTLNQPIVEGVLRVQDATLQAQALTDPLTDVTGTVRFNGDSLMVEQLQADYNDGRLVAEGSLPIFNREFAVTNPLTIALNDLNLDLDGLYQGDVSGNVILTGAALDPAIGGTIQLSDGEIAIDQAGGGSLTSDTELVAESEPADAFSNPSLNAPSNAAAAPAIEFNNLRLVLADDVRVIREPILSFEAAGDVLLNGSLADLRPQGVVELTSGQINLFTTQFVLARGEPQTVRFTPEGGLNPILDIQLFALVPDIAGSPIVRRPTSFSSNEIVETPSFQGTIETVRVEASITGPASELANNLELTSDSNRSESEIVALLGGSFLSTLQANPILGAATLAGSAFLGGDFQAAITELGQAIGLSEFRVFPTLVSEEAGDDASALGLSVEGVVDITNNFSVSVAGVVGAEDPIRYSVIYRVSDDIRVRASTNFSGESRAVVQYQTTF